MNSEQIRYFELVYRERRFASAARLVPMSPQGLAKAIRALEKELDVTLFEPDEATGLLMPTEFAHEFFDFACVFDSNVQLLDEAFDRIRGNEERYINLGCSLGAIGTTGPWFIRGFREAYPHIHVTYRESNDVQCDADLTDGRCSLALTVSPSAPGRRCTPLFRGVWCFWVRKDDPLAAKDVISFEDLAGYDVAIPGEGFRCYERLLRETRDCGVVTGDIFQMSEIFQLFEFAVSGQGLGFSLVHLAKLSAFDNPNVKILYMPSTIWGFDIVCRDTHALTKAEELFWQWSVRFCKTIRGNVLPELDDPFALTAPRPFSIDHLNEMMRRDA